MQGFHTGPTLAIPETAVALRYTAAATWAAIKIRQARGHLLRRLRQNPSKLKSLTLYPKWTKPWHSLRTKPWHSLRRNQQEQCVVGLNDGAVVAREDALIFDRPDVANGRSAHDTYLR